jgi:hypothetical protein
MSSSPSFEAEIDALRSAALSLAVARYLAEDPNAASRAGIWLDEAAAQWSRRSVEDIAAEASRQLDALESWAERVQAERPELWTTRRTEYAHAKLTLQSARSGSFQTAAGPLADFLADMGTAGSELDIH